MNPPSMAIDEFLTPSDEKPIEVASDLPRLSAEAAFELGRIQAQKDTITSLPLLTLDITATLATIILTSAILTGLNIQSLLARPVVASAVVGITVLFQQIHGLYPACGLSYSIEYRRILRTCLMVIAGLSCGLVLHAHNHGFPWLEMSIFALLLVPSLTSVRSLGRHFLACCDWWSQPVVIIGSSERALSLYKRMDKCRMEGLRPLGLVCSPQDDWTETPDVGKFYLGPLLELEQLLVQSGTCRLAVADVEEFSWQEYHKFHGIPHVMLPTELSAHPCERARLAERDGAIDLHCHSTLTSPAARSAKRALDLSLVLLTLPIWLTVMVAIALMIKLTDPGPVFYRQDRVGRFGRSFKAIKFRSMLLDADRKLNEYLSAHPELRAEWEATHKLQKDPRVTAIGAFLRKSSLDEIPQLINVILGDMSLVGPRPIIDQGEYDQQYIRCHPEVFELYQMVRPGITGLWQISGRNSLPYTQRVALDRYYLHNWSLTLDVFILWRTLKTAVFREGAY